MSENELALFDFNGTITKEQILVAFIKTTVHPIRVIAGVLLLWPVLLLYMKRIIPNKTAKELCFTWFFGGSTPEKLRQDGEWFARKKLDKLIIPKALETLRWHVSQGHTVAVVSGSIDLLLAAWCQRENVDLIANQMAIKNGRITGKIVSDNCWGDGKVTLIKQRYAIDRFDKIHAYGNTDGDVAMLALADNGNMNRFN